MEVFEVEGSRLIWRGDGEMLTVEPWGANSLRVRSTVMGDAHDSDWALLEPAPTQPRVRVEGDIATLSNGGITARLTTVRGYDEQVGYDTTGCSITFVDRHGKVLLRELDAGGSLKLRARAFQPLLGGDFRLTASFESDPREKLYGMGQYQQHLLDLKGSTLELAHRNSQASVPFLMSSAGYGFLWHNPAIGRATFGTNRTEWHAESTKQLDYWITAGDTPAQISKAYADATGHVPMMPEYGLGYWQCKLRYWNQAQLLDVVREHKRRGLPLDVVVADFFHWPQMGDFRFDEEFWPDPKAMVAELNDLGVELMVSVWPQVSTRSENYLEFRQKNFLVTTERGMNVQMGFQGPSMFYDFTNPTARRRAWEIVAKNYHAHGVRAFWLDEAEPEYGVYDFDNFRYHLGPNVQVGNVYPQAYARTFYEGQVAAGQAEVVNLVRCAWAGSQRYGALVWSGDIHSTFEDLRRQITVGIHMGIAGIPWFTTDVGGFHDGDVRDPAFHELLIRWMQFGTFCPVMRMHGDRLPYEDVTARDGTPRLRSGGPNELWSFGEDTYAVLSRYLHQRERLRPYTRKAMAEAHESGQPVMRALFHEFPGDVVAWDIDDQFLFGADILVAPVTTAGATQRTVYLPEGATWWDSGSGTSYEGGRHLLVDAPLDAIPVFTRDRPLAEILGEAHSASLTREEGRAVDALSSS
jgi:alpha-D-xyloside xylohydrolase